GMGDRIYETVDEEGGIDTLDFSSTGLVITIDLGRGSFQGINKNLSLALTTCHSIENILGGFGDDKLTGNTLANNLTGGAGDDALYGGPGVDTYIFDADSALGTDTIDASDG